MMHSYKTYTSCSMLSHAMSPYATILFLIREKKHQNRGIAAITGYMSTMLSTKYQLKYRIISFKF